MESSKHNSILDDTTLSSTQYSDLHNKYLLHITNIIKQENINIHVKSMKIYYLLIKYYKKIYPSCELKKIEDISSITSDTIELFILNNISEISYLISNLITINGKLALVHDDVLPF
jgi:hypothetical protein